MPRTRFRRICARKARKTWWQDFRFPRCSTIERLPRKIPSLCELYAIREEPGLVSKLDHTHSLGYRLRLDEQRSWCTLTTVDSKSISSSHEPDRARPESHLERHRRSYPAADFARPERTRRMFHRQGRRLVRLGYRAAHSAFPTHHFASHGDPHQGGISGGEEDWPVEMVSAE